MGSRGRQGHLPGRDEGSDGGARETQVGVLRHQPEDRRTGPHERLDQGMALGHDHRCGQVSSCFFDRSIGVGQPRMQEQAIRPSPGARSAPGRPGRVSRSLRASSCSPSVRAAAARSKARAAESGSPCRASRWACAGRSTQAEQAALEGEESAGHDRRRRCPEVVPGRTWPWPWPVPVGPPLPGGAPSRSGRTMTAGCVGWPRPAVLPSWRATGRHDRVRPTPGRRGTRPGRRRRREGWASSPTSRATANASSDRAAARSVLPHHASSRAREPRPLTFHIG